MHRNLQAGWSPTVHCVLVCGHCLLWASQRLQQRRTEESFFLNPEVSPSSSSTPFILVGCNFMLDTCVQHLCTHLCVGKPSTGLSLQSSGLGGPAGPALLDTDDVPPGTWTHPLGASNPFPGGEGRKEKRGCEGLPCCLLPTPYPAMAWARS